MFPRRGKATGRDGCGFLLATSVFTCIFLMVNGGLAVALHAFLAPLGPAWLQKPQAGQAFMILVPVALLFFEWWLVDAIVLRLQRFRKHRRGRQFKNS